jgi:hypothetical protein
MRQTDNTSYWKQRNNAKLMQSTLHQPELYYKMMHPVILLDAGEARKLTPI